MTKNSLKVKKITVLDKNKSSFNNTKALVSFYSKVSLLENEVSSVLSPFFVFLILLVIVVSSLVFKWCLPTNINLKKLVFLEFKDSLYSFAFLSIIKKNLGENFEFIFKDVEKKLKQNTIGLSVVLLVLPCLILRYLYNKIVKILPDYKDLNNNIKILHCYIYKISKSILIKNFFYSFVSSSSFFFGLSILEFFVLKFNLLPSFQGLQEFFFVKKLFLFFLIVLFSLSIFFFNFIVINLSNSYSLFLLLVSCSNYSPLLKKMSFLSSSSLQLLNTIFFWFMNFFLNSITSFFSFDFCQNFYLLFFLIIFIFNLKSFSSFFTKIADISADFIGKIELNLKEDDDKNPFVLFDNAGDNLGDLLSSFNIAFLYKFILIRFFRIVFSYFKFCFNFQKKTTVLKENFVSKFFLFHSFFNVILFFFKEIFSSLFFFEFILNVFFFVELLSTLISNFKLLLFYPLNNSIKNNNNFLLFSFLYNNFCSFFLYGSFFFICKYFLKLKFCINYLSFLTLKDSLNLNSANLKIKSFDLFISQKISFLIVWLFVISFYFFKILFFFTVVYPVFTVVNPTFLSFRSLIIEASKKSVFGLVFFSFIKSLLLLLLQLIPFFFFFLFSFFLHYLFSFNIKSALKNLSLILMDNNIFFIDNFLFEMLVLKSFKFLLSSFFLASFFSFETFILTYDMSGPLIDNSGGLANLLDYKKSSKIINKLDIEGNLYATLGKSYFHSISFVFNFFIQELFYCFPLLSKKIDKNIFSFSSFSFFLIFLLFFLFLFFIFILSSLIIKKLEKIKKNNLLLQLESKELLLNSSIQSYFFLTPLELLITNIVPFIVFISLLVTNFYFLKTTVSTYYFLVFIFFFLINLVGNFSNFMGFIFDNNKKVIMIEKNLFQKRDVSLKKIVIYLDLIGDVLKDIFSPILVLFSFFSCINFLNFLLI